MAEINVVPYIDVMLVLLVIFMVTAPLLTQGVQVDLPQAPAKVLEGDSQQPLVVHVNAAGEFFIDFGERPDVPVDASELLVKVGAVLRYKPGTPVMVRGDRSVSYGRVVELMALLQKAGVPKVGLVSRNPPEASGG